MRISTLWGDNRQTNRSNQLGLTAKPEDTVWIDLWTGIVLENLGAATLEINLALHIRHTNDDSGIFVAFSGRLLYSRTKISRVVKEVQRTMNLSSSSFPLDESTAMIAFVVL